MCTPSGRFEVNQRICLSMSDFHEELWNPSWSVATIINGLLSFMTGDERTTGSIVTPESTKKELARRSKYYNLYSNVAFKENFPDLCEQNRKDIAEAEREEARRKLQDAAKKEEDEEPEVTTSIDKIQDPEDRIRAEELQENAKRAKKEVQNGSSSLFKVFILAVAIFLGMMVKFNAPQA